jgi:hypothetical protein
MSRHRGSARTWVRKQYEEAEARRSARSHCSLALLRGRTRRHEAACASLRHITSRLWRRVVCSVVPHRSRAMRFSRLASPVVILAATSAHAQRTSNSSHALTSRPRSLAII